MALVPVQFDHGIFGQPLMGPYAMGAPDDFRDMPVEQGTPRYIKQGPGAMRPISLQWLWEEQVYAQWEQFYYVDLKRGMEFMRMSLTYGDGLQDTLVHLAPGGNAYTAVWLSCRLLRVTMPVTARRE